MRNRITIAVCCGLTFFAGLAFGQQAFNASKWNEFGKENGIFCTLYVKGYLEGYNDGDSAMEKIVAVITKGVPPDSATKKLIAPQALRMVEIEGMGKTRDITFGEIENAMGSFYSDYRNATVCWKEALQFSVWSLNGDAATEQEVNAARKRGAENGCQ